VGWIDGINRGFKEWGHNGNKEYPCYGVAGIFFVDFEIYSQEGGFGGTRMKKD
jgi:hypothetical protein